jgi:hypothetical protein
VALLEKRRYLNNRSGDFPQVILIVPSHVPNNCPLPQCGSRGTLFDAFTTGYFFMLKGS